MSENAVQKFEPQTTAVTPMDLLDRAMQRGVDPEALGKLLELQQRWEADQARKAFVQAMAAFKAEPLTITKGKRVHYVSRRTNETTDYTHATLSQVCDAVVATLSKHGLSHRWETSQQDKVISVTCVITHELGHSERTTLSAAPDESGGKNSIQAVGSTVTYLQRYTLMAATGLAAKDMDDDGRSAEPKVETISAKAVEHLEKLIKEASADRAKFLETLGVEKLEDLPAKNFNIAKAALNARIKAAKAEAQE